MQLQVFKYQLRETEYKCNTFLFRFLSIKAKTLVSLTCEFKRYFVLLEGCALFSARHCKLIASLLSLWPYYFSLLYLGADWSELRFNTKMHYLPVKTRFGPAVIWFPCKVRWKNSLTVQKEKTLVSQIYRGCVMHKKKYNSGTLLNTVHLHVTNIYRIYTLLSAIVGQSATRRFEVHEVQKERKEKEKKKSSRCFC